MKKKYSKELVNVVCIHTTTEFTTCEEHELISKDKFEYFWQVRGQKRHLISEEIFHNMATVWEPKYVYIYRHLGWK